MSKNPRLLGEAGLYPIIGTRLRATDDVLTGFRHKNSPPTREGFLGFSRRALIGLK